jgi:hypothetical protein
MEIGGNLFSQDFLVFQFFFFKNAFAAVLLLRIWLKEKTK